MSQDTLFSQVVDYAKRRGFHYEIMPPPASALVFAVRGKSGPFKAVIQVREEESQQVVVYSVSPVVTQAEYLQEMAIFLTRANYGIFIGNFEMDMRDGEVRYKASQDLAKQTLTDDILANLIQISVGAFDQYAPGIKAVAEGTASAQEAIEQIEG